MREKELCNAIYNVATVFRMNDFPCANGSGTNVRGIRRAAILGKQGMFVIVTLHTKTRLIHKSVF